MINTILFDLDGTLLPMDTDKFMKLYFYHMGIHFDGWIDPKLLAKNIMLSTEQMIKINDGRTNQDIFMEHFQTLVDKDINLYKDHFTLYYDTLFQHVKNSTYQSMEMIEAVQILKDKGYELVIATNPLFPIIANYHRIKWAGFLPEDFSHITSFEENTSTKPHSAFYQEVLDKINKKPEECMMIGNDVSDDMAASKLGIKTYLLTNCLINEYKIDTKNMLQGSAQDFLILVKNLPYIN